MINVSKAVCNNIFVIIFVCLLSVLQAHSLAPPPPSVRAMDEERSALAISPEPPDDGDASQPAPQPSLHATSTTEIANSCPNPKPCPSAGKEEVAIGKQDKPTQTAVLTLLCSWIRFYVCWRKNWRLQTVCDGSERALNRLMFITTTTTKFN